MTNPCKQCIVTAMCRVACYKMTAYLLNFMMKYKPEGSPYPSPSFLEYQCGQIRIFPNRNRRIRMRFKNREAPIPCIIEVEDGSIKSIRKAGLNEY